MQAELNILLVEDDRMDAELICETLVSQGIIANVLRVETENEFRTALQNGTVDLILAAYTLPAFEGLTALKITRELRPELPFIFVSGKIGEEIAVESLKSGATDYVLKQDLQRLGLSVRRALNEAEEHNRLINANQAFLESEERHRLFFENSPLPMWVYDLETLRFLAVNEAALDHYGYSREEFLGLTIKDIRPPEDVPALLDNISKVSERFDTAGIWRHRKKNGTIIEVEITSHPIEFSGRQAEIVLVNDITERRRAEEQLRLQSAALESAANAIVITDAKGTIIWVNPAFTQTTGYSAQEALGQNPRLIKSGEQDQAFYHEMWETILAGKVWHNTLVNRRKDGTFNHGDLTITPIRNTAGRITHFVGIYRDNTDRERAAMLLKDTNQRLEQAVSELQTKSGELAKMRQQLWEVSKLAIMGELAASIAHELNNPLATVALSAESLLARLPVDGAQARHVEVILREAERMGSLVSNLLQFSRRSHRQISSIDLREELRNSLEFIQYYLRSHKIDIVQEFAGDLPTVQADRQEFREVFLNLLTNASDAMPEGGTLTVRAIPGTFDNGMAAVVCEFSDTGIGIEEEDLPKLWEPFFTTKPEGKGTGLGLPICRRMVEGHHGTIEIESTTGKGTTVRITLPATEKGAVAGRE